MASKQNTNCPHFGTQDGVCGCPGFWEDANSKQGPKGLALQEVSNTRYGQGARNGQRSSGVNTIPPHDRTKGPAVTPAPPGPPKDTCFFWYHGTCRRGSECDRPHEAHSTWPIPPPPGFRHYEPCMLPLCPLRSDLQGATKSQEYQRGRRAMGGQMDGTALSRSLIGGESFSDLTGDEETDTDLGETGENTTLVTDLNGCDPSPRHSAAPDGHVDDGEWQRAEAAGEVNAELERGRSDSYAPDDLDISSCLSPPSTPLVQEDILLSISHSGTLGKRVDLSTATSPKSTNKRTKLERSTTPDLKDFVSILERPRTMSQWDIKSPVPVIDQQHPDIEPANSKPLNGHLPLLDHMPAAGESSSAAQPQPFNPPKGPRGMCELAPICFFYHHKGHCRPKRGRRCDYLHHLSTPQQTVSLPHGIDNHDPKCPLPLCPIRVRNLDRTSAEQEPLRADITSEIINESPAPSASHATLLPDRHSSSRQDENMPVRDGPLKGILNQPLPHVSDEAKQRFKKQKRMMKDGQAIAGIDSEISAPTNESKQQDEAGNRRRKSHKGKKNRARAKAADRRALDTQPDTSTTQVPLPSMSVKEGVPTHTTYLAADIPTGERKRKRGGKNLPRTQAEYMWIRDIVKGEGSRDFTFEEQQVRVDEALELVRPDEGVPQSDCRCMSAACSQRPPGESIVRHEYSQESLGLTVNQRRQSIFENIAAKRPAVAQALRLQSKAVTLDGSAANVHSPYIRWNGQDRNLLHKPRYLEGCANDMDCGRQSLCQYCEVAGVAPDGNTGRAQGNAAGDADPVGSRAMPAQHSSHGYQRFDWDTDLVRRLFGEIE